MNHSMDSIDEAASSWWLWNPLDRMRPSRVLFNSSAQVNFRRSIWGSSKEFEPKTFGLFEK